MAILARSAENSKRGYLFCAFHAQGLFRIHRRAIVIARPQLSLRGHSSSQASYPSPRRKRQSSSIALLVLSKQQTLRWFAVWFPFCLARKLVGADGFAQPSAPSGALRMRHTPCGCCPPAAHGVREAPYPEDAGDILRLHRSAAFIARPQLSLRGHSSSQASYPAPRRKRQVSSIALLVLSKQQTLRWFAVWFHFCLARKKYAKKRRWTRSIALTRRKTSRYILRFSFHFP